MELTAQKRQEKGKKTRTLRESGKVPAVVFGPQMDSVDVTLGKTEFKRVFAETGETSLIDLKVDRDEYKVLVKDVQLDPITLDYLHIGFYKPNLKEIISADIPVEIVGEEQNELIKSGEALALALVDSIEIRALPTDLPNAFIIDVSELKEIGDGITVGEIKYDRDKVEIVGLEDDAFVAKLDYAEMQEVEEEVSEEEAIAGIEATEETAEEEEDIKEEGETEKEESE